MKRSIWIGYDPREHDAYLVAVDSMMRRFTTEAIDIAPIELRDMRERGLYWRTHTKVADRGQTRWVDDISAAPMSTEFAMSRFLVRELAGSGWALFVDCDVMLRADISDLFDLADPGYAVMCVQHGPQRGDGRKMDGQVQWSYPRKNWSSVMLVNCDHPGNASLDRHLVNTLRGRDLHGFAWLRDEEIGALPAGWNHLVGIDQPDPAAHLAHFTLGLPSMPGYEACEFADEWRAHLALCSR